MNRPPFILTISGSDSSGCAGMQTDNRAIHTAGGYPLNVITALTIQTPKGVERIEYQTSDFVSAQLIQMIENYPVAAIKSGMLGNASLARTVLNVLSDHPRIPYVLDPVILSTSGSRLLEEDAIRVLFEGLLERATLFTPNLGEAEVLLSELATRPGEKVDKLPQTIGTPMLLKGGHRDSDDCEDHLIFADGAKQVFQSPRIESRNLRGTGCALSAAIAALLGRGFDLVEAVGEAKKLLAERIATNASVPWIGEGPSFL